MKKQLAELAEELSSRIDTLWAQEQPTEQWDYMLETAHFLADAISALAESASQNEAAEEEILAFIIIFEWIEQAKNYLILWRDILFESQKAAALHLDGALEQIQLNDLAERSQKLQLSAAQSLFKLPNERLEELNANPRSLNKQLSKWQLLKNPWPVYQNQIKEIAEQCALLRKKYSAFFDCIIHYQASRANIRQMVVSCENEVAGIVESAQNVVAFIEDVLKKTDKPRPGKIINRLDELESNFLLPDYLTLYTEAQEVTTSLLPQEARIPVETDGGIILYRDMNLRRKTRQWLETEVRPALLEVWEETQLSSNSFKLALVNVRNRAILINNESSAPAEINHKDICQPIEHFLENAEIWQKDLRENKEVIEARIEEMFHLSNVYTVSREFLPIPLQTTLRQLRLDENPLFARVETWYKNAQEWFRTLISRVEREESLSISEKIVRVVQARNLNRDASSYAGIFLTKGYIGESFAVGRQEELMRIKKLINNWRLGYRGSVLLHGQRFSGKTLTGDWIANRFFGDSYVRLRPNTSLEFQGRRQELGYNLEEALAFVRKYGLNQPFMVWIDDLELWWNDEISLSKNVRSLKNYINQYGHSQFFMVSTTNWVRQQLETVLDLTQVFQAEVNLDRMHWEDIHQAILIRHGATHKTLVDKEGNELSGQQFERMIKRVYNASRGNPGESMMRWSMYTRAKGEEEVTHKFRTLFALPEFLNSDQEIILRTLMMKKRASQHQLRKIFGPAYKEKYRPMIQQMLSLGLLNRRMGGELEINEVLVNDIGRMLEQRHVLTFNAR
ncbi:MAG: hypothetical protein AAF927_16090 [Bacteroidota bacterium]